MRIVSLLPSATEILFDIGAGPQVVGVTHECDYPSGATTLPKLTASALPQAGSPAEIDRHVRRSLHEGSSLYHLDADLLERLAPDLIVTQELCAVCAVSYEIVERAVRRLRGDPRLISLEPSSLDDVFATIAYLGPLTGHRDGADALVDALRTRVDALRERTGTRAPRPRVLVLEWTDPPMSGGHWTPGLVELAGAQPVLGNPGANSQVLEWTAIAREDPDAIVVGPCGFDLERTRAAIAQLDRNAIWRSLRAVREDRVYPIDGNAYLNRPGPRLVDTAEIIAALLDTETRAAARPR
ncbi:MAG TPA: cobalamin-binding protein [Candidatus Baltobacteraceae bacterium]|nr:cobalamin-binding protein [Candidatus Baltobacteraceae bacterium]